MRRKAVHIAAAVAEFLRFAALAFLAFGMGALLDPSVSALLRYAAAPQLLFAAGFFFMWLDPERYSTYKPLLLVGKAAAAVCLVPLAAVLLRSPGGAGLALCFPIALVDFGSLCVLALATDKAEGPGAPAPRGPKRSAERGAEGRIAGQGPDDIETVEGL